MPVLNRAELSRTGVVFVALPLAICATGAAAREFRADTRTEDGPANATLIGNSIPTMSVLAMPMAAISAKAAQNPAAAVPIAPLRKVE